MNVLFCSFFLALVVALGGGCSAHSDAAPQHLALSPAMQPVALAESMRTDSLAPGFVYLRHVAPTIIQEMRYTTAFNFVGAPIDGYEAPECVLTERAARALAALQAELEPQRLSLKVYDCYRPQRAVDHFVRWAQNDERTMKRAFYPDEPKTRLFARGYIARRSGHSRGSTVDLTLVPLPYEAPEPYPHPDSSDALPRCDVPLDAPFDARYREGDLDMGTTYDCLSPRSATTHASTRADVLQNRLRLRDAMSRHGFRNYAKEWWHYTLRNEPFRSTYFDFPITATPATQRSHHGAEDSK